MTPDTQTQKTCPTCGASITSIFDHVDGCPDHSPDNAETKLPFRSLQYWSQQAYVVAVSIAVLGATQKWGITLAVLVPFSLWLWEYNSKPNAASEGRRSET